MNSQLTLRPAIRRLVGFATLAAVIAAWGGVIAFYALGTPTLAQWTIAVTIAAVVTEAGLWIGVALLGLTALQRLRFSRLFGA